MTSSSVPPGQGSAATKRGVALGALVLSIAAGGALWWRAQPAAPSAPAPTTASAAPAPEPAPQAAFVPAPQPAAPLPAAATTIVLADDTSPVEAAVEPTWDGKTVRDVQDAAHVLRRHVDALGGPEAVEAHRRFTAHINIEAPFYLRGKLLFDWKKGLLLTLDDVPTQLLWQAKGGCLVLYGPRRAPLPCTPAQTDLANSLWEVAGRWAGHWDGVGDASAAKAIVPVNANVLMNSLQFRNGASSAMFAVETGELTQLGIWTFAPGVDVNFGRVTTFQHGWTAASEWRLQANTSPTAPAAGTVSADEAKDPWRQELVLVVRQVHLGVDPSAMAVPATEALRNGMGAVRIEAERASTGYLFRRPASDRPDPSAQETPTPSWTDRYRWPLAFIEDAAIITPSGEITYAYWLPSKEFLPVELRDGQLDYPPHIGWATALAETEHVEDIPKGVTRLSEAVTNLGKTLDGPAYVRAAGAAKKGATWRIYGEFQAHYR